MKDSCRGECASIQSSTYLKLAFPVTAFGTGGPNAWDNCHGGMNDSLWQNCPFAALQ
jgi:hypothetical protein